MTFQFGGTVLVTNSSLYSPGAKHTLEDTFHGGIFRHPVRHQDTETLQYTNNTNNIYSLDAMLLVLSTRLSSICIQIGSYLVQPIQAFANGISAVPSILLISSLDFTPDSKFHHLRILKVHSTRFLLDQLIPW